MISPLVGNVGEYVRKRRAATAGQSTARPGVALPSRDRAVFLTCDLDLAVSRRTVAGDLLLHGAVQEQLHRPTACLLRQHRGRFGPSSGTELAPESAADVVHLDLD